MMPEVHAIVWLDHREAKVIGFSFGKDELIEVHSESPERRIHHNDIRSGKAPDDHDFFDGIVAALADMQEVLVTGPGNAKTAFMTYVRDRHPDLAGRIVGIETLDHPTDPQLLAHAKTYFGTPPVRLDSAPPGQ